MLTKFVPDDGEAGDFFGISVALSGDTIVVEASFDDGKGSSSGSAYVYQKNSLGLFKQVSKLVTGDGVEFDSFRLLCLVIPLWLEHASMKTMAIVLAQFKVLKGCVDRACHFSRTNDNARPMNDVPPEETTKKSALPQ